MGECLISRRGGEAYSLHVLNAGYPQDVTVTASANGVAVFYVQISEHGRPAEYTYQWYVNGIVQSGANEDSYIVDTTDIGTHTVYCVVTNKAGSVTSRTATLTVKDYLPEYSYDGDNTLTKEGNYNWNIALKTSGTLKFDKDTVVDAFLVGGGGGGGRHVYGGGGGGGGYTTTALSLTLKAGQSYSVVIGAGGAGAKWQSEGSTQGGTGGSTSAFGNTVNGGNGGGWDIEGGSGGSGGGGGSKNENYSGGAGGSDGSDGVSGSGGTKPGTGQKTTTRAFGEINGDLYAGGGGGGSDGELGGGSGGGAAGGEGGGGSGGGNAASGSQGKANTGGGGGGGGGDDSQGGVGGSGVVIIRNTR